MDPPSLPQYIEGDAIRGQVPHCAQLRWDAALEEMGLPAKDPIQHHLFHDSVCFQTRGPHGLQVDVAFPCLLGLQLRKRGHRPG